MPFEPSQDTLHSLIRMIYEAAVDPEQWPAFLKSYGEAVCSPAVGLVVIDSGDGFGHVDATVNVDPAYQASFVSHYAAHNPWTAPDVAHLWAQGGVVEGRETISDEAMVKTEFYNDFLKPQGWFAALGGCVMHTKTMGSYLTALRRREVDPDFGRGFLTALMPHLQTALRLHERVSALESAASALSDVLQYIPGCVMIVDHKAKVLALNPAAESFVAAQNGLSIDHGYLVALNPGESIALQTMISVAIRAREGEMKAPIPVNISRNEKQKPLQILLAPLPPQLSGGNRQPCAILFISNPDDAALPNQEFLRRRYGFTDAETRIAADLTMGKSVDKIAAERFISPDTVRSHLRKIYSKTGTNRQGQLISLLLQKNGAS